MAKKTSQVSKTIKKAKNISKEDEIKNEGTNEKTSGRKAVGEKRKAIRKSSQKAHAQKAITPEQLLAQREAELDLINGIQQGLAAELDFQAIVDLVGDKLREVFNTPDLAISWYNEKDNLVNYLYFYEHGKRMQIEPRHPTSGGIFERMQKSRQPVIWNSGEEGNAISPVIPGTDTSKSGVSLPIISSDRVLGIIQLENYERENAYGESELRLLTTIAASLGAALENARLFDETQRLLKITEDRAAELAIINAVQRALAAELDIHGIYDAVGEKLREIFDAQTVSIYSASFKKRMTTVEYNFEKGRKFDSITVPFNSLHESLILSDEILLRNGDFPQYASQFKDYRIPAGEIPLSVMSTTVYRNRDADIWVGVSIQDMDGIKTFNDSDVRLLETVAGAMSVALQNARLFDQTQRLLKETEQRNAELAIINSIQQGLASKLDMLSIYEMVGEQLHLVFHQFDISVGAYDSNTDLVHAGYMIEHGKRIDIPPFKVGGIGFIGELIRTRRTILVNENLDEESKRVGSYTLEGTDSPRSHVMVPLIVNESVRGLVVLQDMQHENAFSALDVRLLETIANSMSVALENARLFDEVQKKNIEITEAFDQQSASNEVLRVMAGSPTDFQPVLEVIARNAAHVCGADDAHIYRIDGEALREWTHLGPIPGLEDGEWLPLNRGSVIGRAILDRKPIHIRDSEVELDESEYPISVALQRRWGYRTVLAIPLLREGEPIGGIAIRRNVIQPFTDKEIDLLKSFADQAVIAIENVRLFTETQRLLKETEQRAAELAIINSVQEGLASKLEIRAIYELIGENIREIFNADTTYINTYEKAEQLVYSQYYVDKGHRIVRDAALPFGEGLYSRVIQTRQPILVGTRQGQVDLGVTLAASPDSEQDLNESYLGVPILLGNEVTGVVSVQAYKQNAFSESDVGLLTTLANSMSVALENAHLFDETQRLLKETEERNAELAVINSVQQALAAQLDLQGIYDAVGNKIREIFDAQSVIIGTLDHERSEGMFNYFYEKGERFYPDPVPLSGMMEYMAKNGEIVVINENMLERSKEFNMITPAGEEPKSGIWMPIKSGKLVRGIITLQNIDHENAFPESDVRLLETLASSMSVALENARLFDETQRLLKETEQRAAELALINSVQQGLASKLDIQTIIDLVGDKVRDVFDTQTTYIALHDKVSETFRVPYYLHQGSRVVIDGLYPAGKGPTGHIIQTRETLWFNEDADRRTQGLGATNVADDDRPRSWLGVPMIAGDEVVGVVSLQNIERENAYSESDVSLLKTIASSLAVALQNAQLFEETNRLLKETEDRNAELAIINSVQQGLASKLDYQSIIELVGDKLRDIFNVQSINITGYDSIRDLFSPLYTVERDVRLTFPPMPPGPIFRHIINTRESLIFRTKAEFEGVGAVTVPGTELSQSGIYVPLLQGKEFMGVIALENVDQENAFDEADLRLLTTLANSMSVALENARLFDETQRLLKETEQRAAELAIINSVQEGLASKLDMQAIFDLVGDKIRDMFNAQSTIISTFDHEKQVSRLEYGFEDGQRVYDEDLLPLSPLNRHMIETRQPVVINQNSAEESARYGLKVIEGTQPARSLIFVPFGTGVQVNGYFSLQNMEHYNAFTESDVRLLQTLAGSMGIAIENARLFNAEQQRAAELGAISTVTQALVAETELDNMIQLIGSQMREIFQADIAYVALLEPQTNIIRFPYQHGENFTTLMLGEGLTSKIIQSGEPLLINKDIQERRAQLGASLVGRESLSYLGVPIKSGGETIGVLSVQSVIKEGVYDQNDLRLLTTIAANAGSAIHTAQLHAETQRNAHQIATIANVGRELSATLNLDIVVRTVVENVHSLFHARDTILRLVDAKSQSLHTTLALGLYAEENSSDVLTLGEGITGSIAQSGIAEVVDNVELDPR
ncbi:MAG TPA: GAF domain-containing protein, partial [Anaerolineales bacterium]|nr:GAF domain-containing protein [Anaerolineales bacterium]